MPAQVVSTVENNFTKGLITEFTGLNFPENAATDTDNCLYTLVGDVARREGIDREVNGITITNVAVTGNAINTYLWKNAGGDGASQIVVEQTGNILSFFLSSKATVAAPLSTTELIADRTSFNVFQVSGSLTDLSTTECQFTDGNGYLFVFHPLCDPFYCIYVPATGLITLAPITVKIRDFLGVPETTGVNSRPPTLTAEHSYNLQNQGWTSGSAWIANSTTTLNPPFTGSKAFTVPSGLTISGGDTVNIYDTGQFAYLLSGAVAMTGTVSSYVGTTLTITITFAQGAPWGNLQHSSWQLQQTNLGHVTSWFSAIGNYPSNADVWWYFKDTTGVFNPTVTAANVTLGASNAPKGHFILSAFNQRKDLASGLAITSIATNKRPTTGCWFQGRVWYAGVDDSQAAIGDAPFYTWTENIYFSQIVQGTADFGNCYQTNDPTSETLFDLLPTDGGVITIQGSGKIYKLFALQNALLIFAANGVWYLTGSQGIGFSANDYTIVKLSSVRSISSTSFVNVQGLPYFWNEEGIYAVEPAKQGAGLLNSPLHVNPLEVVPITVGTIQTFYDSIPTSSKKYVRGDYDPIDYRIQWIFRSTVETDVTSRYKYNRMLNYNTFNKAFFPYTLGTSPSGTAINGITYVSYPGGTPLAPTPTLKYVISDTSQRITFADEHDTAYTDFFTSDTTTAPYTSFFVTGFKLHGQGQKRFQIPYVYVFSRTGAAATAYKIQGLWDYATSGNTGRWSIPQIVNTFAPNFGMIFKRHRIRGQGLVLQIKVSSVSGQPFDIMGWSTFETVNQGI